MNGGDRGGFAAWVRGLRRRLGLTQGELGKRVGVGQGTVSHWERGKTVPLPGKRARLAELAEGVGLGPPPPGPPPGRGDGEGSDGRWRGVTESRPAWYLPVGEPLDPARAAMLVEGFREEVVRVGRALRRRVEAERPGATITARLYEPRHLLGPRGHARSDRLHGVGLGHLVVGGGFGADVVPVCVGWEDGRVSAVVGGERWYPETEA